MAGTGNEIGHESSRWSERYGERHRFRRVTEFPPGIEPPGHVRIYRRSERYLLQWWDPAAKKNQSERVAGDLVSAIVRGREIEERLEHFGSSGTCSRRLRQQELVDQYISDLQRRADAGEITAGTVSRYRSALSHYVSFVRNSDAGRRCPTATGVDREFALEFAAALKSVRISPNGHPASGKRPMMAPEFVLGVVRGLFAWAADPERGSLMSAGFRNPFRTARRRSDRVAADPLEEPDITLEMAARFLAACDSWQLPLFALLAFYGLRPSEPCWLFAGDLTEGWLKMGCRPELQCLTKGRRDKRLPLMEPLASLLSGLRKDHPQGLLFVRRSVREGHEHPPLANASPEALTEVFADRCEGTVRIAAKKRLRLRDRVIREAGGLNYDRIEHEFHRVAGQLNWPMTATLKDFRHLFSTSLQNAGMPTHYVQHLLGHSTGRAAIVRYTHLNALRERYEEAVQREFGPLVHGVTERARELGLPGSGSHQSDSHRS